MVDDAGRPDSVSPTHRIGVVISTLGRPGDLDRLLGDLEAQTVPPDRVAVCDQSAPGVGARTVAEVCAAHPSLDIRVTRTARGLSRGRNAAAALLEGEVDYLFFPNDTSRLDPQFFTLFAPERRAVVVAAEYRDSYGARATLTPGVLPLDKKNVWLILEPAMFIRERDFVDAGGFDIGLGSGADSPWQSGEGTELLLRLAARGGVVQFDPRLVVRGIPESAGLSRAERHRKLRAYGRGYGHILRVWNYGAAKSWGSVLGGFTLGVRQRGRFSPGDGWHVGVGRAEGIMNRTFGMPQVTAVER